MWKGRTLVRSAVRHHGRPKTASNKHLEDMRDRFAGTIWRPVFAAPRRKRNR